MRIVHFISDGYNEFNSSRWRACNQSDALIKNGHQVRILNIQHWIHQTPEAIYAITNSDFIVIHRVLVKESVERVIFWRDKGKIVIADFDDSYPHVAPSNPAYEFWIKGQVTVKNQAGEHKMTLPYSPLLEFDNGLKECSGVTVPSEVLVDDYKNKCNIHYLPNYIDADKYLEARKPKVSDNIFIGYGGSLGHIQSFSDSGISNALKRILIEYKNVYLYLIGDKRITEVLNIPKDKLRFINYVPYNTWPQVVNKYDISIAPLSGEFDKRRSFIKALEASIMGKPFIGTSDIYYPVYKHFFNHPSHVYIQSTGDEREELWYQAIKNMVDNLDDWRNVAESNIHRGIELSAENNIDNIISVYERIRG